MKKAFTLAEVLVTLAIIGVVAAITIPAVIHKYQQKVFYTQFMKFYNTINTAYQLSTVENGTPENWANDTSQLDAPFKNYIGKYLKVANYCTHKPQDCDADSNLSFKPLNTSGSGYNVTSAFINSTHASLILQDGTFLSVNFMFLNGSFGYSQITVDINGLKKGPNQYGRDVFEIDIDNETPTKIFSVHPRGLYEKNGTKYINVSLDKIKNKNTHFSHNCTTDGESFGYNCAARLLLERKMDY